MIALLSLFASLSISPPASAAAPDPDLWCLRGDERPCRDAELADPVRFRQFLFFPSGFTASERPLFESEFRRMVRQNRSQGTSFGSRYADRILYVAKWVPGGALGTPEAAFGGRIFPHPIRGKALTLDQRAVVQATDALGLSPISVALLFNTFEQVTANAAPPTYLQKPYGIARFTRSDIDYAYVPIHELGHSAMNFLDEYIEGGFENISISVLDTFTPLALFNGSWDGLVRGMSSLVGNYDVRVSEALAAAGGDNTDVTRHPSRVTTAGYAPNSFEKEGGVFFGKGTFHDSGKNLMGGFGVNAPDDGFAYAHSPSQQGVLQTVFETPDQAPRPNDRIRSAGPRPGHVVIAGNSTRVLLYDGDKLHRWHPTQEYTVQVGWYRRDWKTCWKGPFPYPCYEQKWTTVEKVVQPVAGVIDLPASRAMHLGRMIHGLACHLGLQAVKNNGQPTAFCSSSLSQMAEAFLPSLRFPMPYQEVEIPLPQWMSVFHWRFRTRNVSWTSGWTAWSPVQRGL